LEFGQYNECGNMVIKERKQEDILLANGNPKEGNKEKKGKNSFKYSCIFFLLLVDLVSFVHIFLVWQHYVAIVSFGSVLTNG
jgi:hypothetical protein